MIVYEGKSRFDNKPIVCIATKKSKNSKTGDMIQTWIMRSDIGPIQASQTGEDKSVCGSCIHRGASDGKHAKGRSCYVNLPFGGPNSIYRAYKDGKYPKLDWSFFEGNFVRFGSYGEIVNVPFSIVSKIAKKSSGWTGYSHAFKQKWAQPYKKFLMASVDKKEDIALAKTLGWRYFRVRGLNDEPIQGEMQCPASKEQNHRLTCVQCRACNGAKDNPNRVSVTILAHGSPPALANAKRNLLTLSTTKLTTIMKTISKRGVTSYASQNQ